MEFTPENKKKLKLLGIIGGIAMVGLVALNFVGGNTAEEDEQTSGNVYAEIQDPDTEDFNGSKIEGGNTRKDNISGWWDDLGEVKGEEETQGGSSDTVPTEDIYADTRREASRTSNDEAAKAALGMDMSGALTAEELRAILEENNRSQNNGYSGGGSSSGSYSSTPRQSQPVQTQPVEPVSQAQPEQATASEPEPEKGESRISIPTTDIRRSSPISSFDDDWTTADGGSGVSSFETRTDRVSTDDRHPFKCMFIREEKLSNGQRVTLRLLEDIVVGGVVITSNSHITAIAKITNRLELEVTSYERSGAIYSLNYEAYDNDGLKGIYCPSLSAVKDQAGNDAAQMATTYGATRMGRLASDITNSAIQIFRSAKGEVTVCVPQGYTFYIVKKQEQ